RAGLPGNRHAAFRPAAAAPGRPVWGAGAAAGRALADQTAAGTGDAARRRARRAIGGGAVRAASPGAVVGAAYRGNVRRAVGDVLGPRPPRRSFPRWHRGGLGGGPWVAGGDGRGPGGPPGASRVGPAAAPRQHGAGDAEPDFSRRA